MKPSSIDATLKADADAIKAQGKSKQQLLQERAELVAALRALLPHFYNSDVIDLHALRADPDFNNELRAARAALAKVEAP